MLNNILGKVTYPQHASVHNKVSRVKNLEGGIYAPPPPPGPDRVKTLNTSNNYDALWAPIASSNQFLAENVSYQI